MLDHLIYRSQKATALVDSLPRCRVQLVLVQEDVAAPRFLRHLAAGQPAIAAAEELHHSPVTTRAGHKELEPWGASQELEEPGEVIQMAVVVKAVLGSHFGW